MKPSKKVLREIRQQVITGKGPLYKPLRTYVDVRNANHRFADILVTKEKEIESRVRSKLQTQEADAKIKVLSSAGQAMGEIAKILMSVNGQL